MVSIDDLVKAVDALSHLFSSIAWPCVAVAAIVKLGPHLKVFVLNMGELSLKGLGVEVIAKRKAEAAAALAAASAARFENAATSEVKAREAADAADLVSDVVTPMTVRHASEAQVLWVDDRPSNNILERKSLEALGVRFSLATSTEEALSLLSSGGYDAVISDMGRPPDDRAGYTLLEKMRSAGDKTPFIIYAGSRAPEHQAEARRRGGLGCTNRPDELFGMVLRALEKGYRNRRR